MGTLAQQCPTTLLILVSKLLTNVFVLLKFLLVLTLGVFVAATRCSGNRQDQFPPGNLFVSVSEGLWDNGAACGRRYRLRCLSGARKPCKDGTIDVKVIDFCSARPCPSTILLSNDAFAAISHSPTMKINVEYIQ